jgi:hypothetical protein
MRDEEILDQLPKAKCHLSFFNWKSRDECSATLETAHRLSYWHWPAMAQSCLLRLFQLYMHVL